jgi:hypothetical protein
VAGRYRLVALAGSGGMGRIWRAHDELLDRVVALKELLSPAEERVMREARAAARLEHPGVVRVYDVVRATGRSWIVMEYVESRSLQERITGDGPLPHPEAARIGLAVLSALRATHAAGVLHHDVKPHNVLLGVDGRIVLTDFGVAIVDAAPVDAAPVFGSPDYVAPERLRKGVPSVAADLWSLGATLYAAVEGRPPFVRPSVEATLTAVLAAQRNLSRHPGPLHPIIADLMVPDPARRMTAAAAQAALESVAARASVTIPAARRSGESTVRFRPARVAPVARTSPDPSLRQASRSLVGRRAWRHRLAFGVVAVAVLGTAGSAVVRGQHDGHGTVRQPSTAASIAAGCGPAAEAMPDAAVRPPSALPSGWRWHRDIAGFELAVPRMWTRATNAGAVCFGDSTGSRTLTVTRGRVVSGGPLQHWQAAERAALADGTLPGYRRISMGVLLVTGGGADWEYVWQPATGPRLHTHRVLISAKGPRAYELEWTAPDDDWAASLVTERTVLASFRDAASPATPWAVPKPE